VLTVHAWYGSIILYCMPFLQIQYEITRVRQKMKDLALLHDKHMNRPTLDDSSEEEHAIEITTQEITQVGPGYRTVCVLVKRPHRIRPCTAHSSLKCHCRKSAMGIKRWNNIQITNKIAENHPNRNMANIFDKGKMCTCKFITLLYYYYYKLSTVVLQRCLFPDVRKPVC